MQFHLSDEQEMIRAVVRDFAQSTLAPSAMARDERAEFDRDIFESMREMGLTGIPWPEQIGGSGGDYLTFAIVLEELSRICASSAAILSAHIVYCGFPLYQFGSEEQKKSILKATAKGTSLGTGAIAQLNTRIASGEDGNSNHATATRDGSYYILDGTIHNVSHAGEADLYVVLAKMKSRKRTAAYSAFLIEKGTKGLSMGPIASKLGLRSNTTASIYMDKCRILHSKLIGHEGQGLEIARAGLSMGRWSTAALAVGIAQGAMETAIAYAKVRKQFGKSIGNQQGISFKLAEMATRTEAARLLTYQAAWLMDQRIPNHQEAAMAYSFALRAAEFVTVEAVQVLGGYGYMSDYKVERYMRDVRCLHVTEY